VKEALLLPRTSPLSEPEDENEHENRDTDDHADRREPNGDLCGTDLGRHLVLLVSNHERLGVVSARDTSAKKNSRTLSKEVNPHAVTDPAVVAGSFR